MRISNRTINLLLGAIALGLFAVCIASIMSPVRFADEQAARETVVKQRLIKIRAAETAFLARHGRYCASLDSLVSGGYLADSLKFIPFSAGKMFELDASTVTTKSGKHVPVMECGARYEHYMEGMDENSVYNLTAKAGAMGLYPGLKIGSLTSPGNTAGNWE